jgi:hypothetical protein
MKSPEKGGLQGSGAEQYGFNAVHHLDKDTDYEGNASFVILVWNDNQILPAEQYRKANYQGQVVDIVVCEDPNVKKAKLGDKALIYNFGGASSSGGGK